MAEEIKSDDLIERALSNIINDRQKLEDLYSSLSGITGSDESDSMALALVGDNLVKIVDSLTKQNGQIVELAKLKQKRSVATGTPMAELDQETRESLYGEIEDAESESSKDYS